MNGDDLKKLQNLIAKLRNRKQVNENFSLFKGLIEKNYDELVESINLRWLISICDTYADFGNEIERRNAFLISLFVNMIRISDTYTMTLESVTLKEKVYAMKKRQFPLFDGLMTLNIDRQDTCLNLTKRITRLLLETPVLYKIFLHVINKIRFADSLIFKLSQLSARPEYFFPENACELPDNYGIV